MNANLFPQVFYLMAIIAFLAIIIGLIPGEPPWKPPYVLHPTVWMTKKQERGFPSSRTKILE